MLAEEGATLVGISEELGVSPYGVSIIADLAPEKHNSSAEATTTIGDR